MTENQDEEVIPKVLDFLRKKPHFFDECNPLFYDAIQKFSEKNQFAQSFDPLLTVAIVSAKIRYIIHKIIDDFYLIKKGKKPKWKYFNEAKFMLPALMTKTNVCSEAEENGKIWNRHTLVEINEISDSEESDDKDNNVLKKIPKNEQKSKDAYCKICNFFCPLNLYKSHFQLIYHKKGEEKWKQINGIEEIQCPRCENVYELWYDLLDHIQNQHQLQNEDINYKFFRKNNKRLIINMSCEFKIKNNASAQLFYEKENLSDIEFMKTVKNICLE